jgi:hypothetical protein
MANYPAYGGGGSGGSFWGALGLPDPNAGVTATQPRTGAWWEQNIANNESQEGGGPSWIDPETGLSYMRLGNSGGDVFGKAPTGYAVGNYTRGGEYSIYDSNGQDTGQKGRYSEDHFAQDIVTAIAAMATAGLAGGALAGGAATSGTSGVGAVGGGTGASTGAAGGFTGASSGLGSGLADVGLGSIADAGIVGGAGTAVPGAASAWLPGTTALGGGTVAGTVGSTGLALGAPAGLWGPAALTAGGAAGLAAGGTGGGGAWEAIKAGASSLVPSGASGLSQYAGPAASLIGGVYGAKQAGKAADAQIAAGDRSNDLQKAMFDKVIELQEPFRQNGLAGSNRLAEMMGLRGDASTPGFGELNRKFTMADRDADPVYQSGLQFGLDQGAKAINNRASAGGSFLSGATLKALSRFGNDYGTTKAEGAYSRFTGDQTNRYNRLAGIAGSGQTATNQMGAAGENYAARAGDTMTGQGNARAAGIVGGANAISGGIGGAYNAWQQNQLMDMIRNPRSY